MLAVEFVGSERLTRWTAEGIRLSAFVAIFSLGNVAGPLVAHAIPGGGLIFLPIFFFTAVATCRFGLATGMLVAVASPLLNHALTGLPPDGMIGSIATKGVVLAVATVLFWHRSPRPSPFALLSAGAIMQAVGVALDCLAGSSLETSAGQAVLGLPGLALIGIGGFLTLRLLVRLNVWDAQEERASRA
jgi:hypothetical protein